MKVISNKLSYVTSAFEIEILHETYIIERSKMAKKGRGKKMVLSAELAAILGTAKGEKLAKMETLKRLFTYINENNLKDPENKLFFTPNKVMAPIFGTKSIKAFGMTKYLKGHFTD